MNTPLGCRVCHERISLWKLDDDRYLGWCPECGTLHRPRNSGDDFLVDTPGAVRRRARGES